VHCSDIIVTVAAVTATVDAVAAAVADGTPLSNHIFMTIICIPAEVCSFVVADDVSPVLLQLFSF
jgi:hypothetical protein